jgi:ribosomal protein S12 methylthiotransferase
MTFLVITLGCFKNRVDSELLIQQMEKNYSYVADDDADIIIINTCSFIEEAKQESINTILSYAERDAMLIVAGCLGQQYGGEIIDEIPGVDAVVGVYAYKDIRSIIEALKRGERVVRVRKEPDPGSVPPLVRQLLSPSHSAFIKLSDGCNRQCSFCIIPSLKGVLRSRSMDSIVTEAKGLARNGVKEINLISQETTSYGIDRYGKRMLVGLLQEILKIPELRWIRLLYNFPGEIDDALLSCIAENEKVCNYLDVPIQHISERMLRAMKREASGKHIRRSLSRIRERYPDVRLRTTLLVGFPGETEEEFKELCAFVHEMEFDRLGVFTYSREKGTSSYRMKGQVPEEEKRERARAIMEMQASISLRKNRTYIGKTVPVLVDGPIQRSLWDGRTEYDAPEIDNGVLVEGEGKFTGEIIRVKITNATEYDLHGHFVQARSNT